VLKAALHCHILITGPEKRAALERAADLPEDQAPIATVLKTATIHWAE
jgi:6-phosphogluconolactonase